MTARPSRTAPAKKVSTATGLARAWNPRHGLLAAAMACLVARVLVPSESAIDDVAGAFFALAWIGIAGLTALEGWRGAGPAWRPMGSEIAILALACWYAISAAMAMQTGSPRPALNAALMWIGFAAAYFSLRRLLQHSVEQRAAVALMVSLACAVSAVGIEQFAIEMPLTRAAYRANPEAALRELNIPAAPDARERILFEQRLESSEPFATFALTNSLAGFLTAWLLVSAFIAWQGFAARSARQWVWLGPLLTSIPIALCLLLTKSRSAYLAVAAGGAIGLLLLPAMHKRLRGRWLLAGAGVVALLVVIGGKLGALDLEVITEAGKSLGYRGQYWQASVEMIADHPLFGVGPGQFQTIYTQYKAPTASEVVADPHNFLLEVAATSGIPALLLLLLFIACAVMEWSCSLKHAVEPAVAEAPSPATKWIIGGGLLGVILAIPIGLLAYSMPSPTTFVVSFLALLVSLALWHAWGTYGALDHYLPLIAAAALLVNLLAAGGIGIPAVSGTLWLLVALCAQPPLVVPEARRTVWYPAAWTVAMGVALVAAYFLSFRPMTAAQAAHQSADSDRRHAEQHLLEATAADDWSAMPWRGLAAWRYERWQRDPTAANWKAVDEAMREDLKRVPQSAVAWAHAGEWRRKAYEQLHDAVMLHQAIEAFATAARLYPNSAAHQADLAEALALAGRSDEAQPHAAKAIDLDDVTPHADLKLAPARRREMERLATTQKPAL